MDPCFCLSLRFLLARLADLDGPGKRLLPPPVWRNVRAGNGADRRVTGAEGSPGSHLGSPGLRTAARLATRVPGFTLAYSSLGEALDAFGLLESQLEAVHVPGER
jgi:hypothetical protein